MLINTLHAFQVHPPLGFAPHPGPGIAKESRNRDRSQKHGDQQENPRLVWQEKQRRKEQKPHEPGKNRGADGKIPLLHGEAAPDTPVCFPEKEDDYGQQQVGLKFHAEKARHFRRDPEKHKARNSTGIAPSAQVRRQPLGSGDVMS
ncbi:MAG TPA: hypothetical protein VGM54_12135 [Chthoniobacter sp.]